MQEDNVTIVLEEDKKESPWLALFADRKPQTAGESAKRTPDQVDLCPFAINSKCKFTKETCKFIHGSQCPYCNKFCLHPFRKDEQDFHLQECRQRALEFQSENHQHSSQETQVECAICFENVLETSEARFGLLNCEHAFCLACIKTWRMQNEKQTMGRSCPICRTLSHFVTPSCFWPISSEQKYCIIERYKEKLSSIDCKHFQFGEGDCPFGSSCFYAHRDRKGNDVGGNCNFTPSRTVICPDGSIHAVPFAKMSEWLTTN